MYRMLWMGVGFIHKIVIMCVKSGKSTIMFSFGKLIIQTAVIKIEINKEKIAEWAEIRSDENDSFRVYLQNRDSKMIDQMVHELNATIEPLIDCTACGACCNGLMINVTQPELEAVAAHLNTTESAFKEQHIEESLGGMMIMNTIPCHFLNEKKCSIYNNRFKECRDFPHLHKPNFTDRLFGTLMHYSICPIIFNVVEQLKINTQFLNTKAS